MERVVAVQDGQAFVVYLPACAEKLSAQLHCAIVVTIRLRVANNVSMTKDEPVDLVPELARERQKSAVRGTCGHLQDIWHVYISNQRNEEDAW